MGYSFKTDNFNLRFEPVMGFNLRLRNGRYSYGRVSGAKLLTTYNSNFSLYAHLQDRGDFNDYTETDRKISPLRGYEFQREENGFEYSDVISGISIGNNVLRFIIAKIIIDGGMVHLGN